MYLGFTYQKPTGIVEILEIYTLTGSNPVQVTA